MQHQVVNEQTMVYTINNMQFDDNEKGAAQQNWEQNTNGEARGGRKSYFSNLKQKI